MEPKNEQIGQNNLGNAADDWENVSGNGHNDVEPVHAVPPAPMAVPESEKVSLSAEAPTDADEAPEEVMDEEAEAAAEEKDAAIGSQAMKINLGTPADAPENTDGDTAEQVETEGQDEPDEDYPRMDAKTYVEEGLREGRLQKVKAAKFGRILAERGMVGQEVISWSVNADGTENDEKRAKIESSEDEWIFTKADDDGKPVVDENGHLNQWIAKNKVLDDKYEADPEHPGVYKPKGQAQDFVKTDQPMTLVQWGEEYKLPEGSMINVTDPEKPYGINPRDFADTYRIIDEAEEPPTEEADAKTEAAETSTEKTEEVPSESEAAPTEAPDAAAETEKSAEKTEMSMEDKLAAHWQVVDRRAMEGEGIERDIYGERVDNTSEVIYLDELEQYSQEQEALRLEQQESERRESLHESLVKAPRTRDLTPEERDFFYEVYGVWPD